MDLNFDSETSFQQSSTLQPIQPAQSSLSTAQPTPDNLPPPLFDAFHQLPHGDFKPQFFNPFEVKHRRRTSRAQFKVLEKTFMDNPKPNATIRRVLAQKLNMTARGVQVWFQNRRAKAKLQRDVTDRRSSFDSTNGSCSEPEPDFQIEDVDVDEHEDGHQLNVPTKEEEINSLESLPNVLIGNDPSSGTYPDYQDNFVGSRTDSSVAKVTDISSCSRIIQPVVQSVVTKKHSVRTSSDQLEIAHDTELQVIAEQRQREVYVQREQRNLNQQRPVNSLAMRNSWSGGQFSSLIQPNSTGTELHRSYALRPDMYESLINPLVSSSTISLPDTLPAYERSYNSTISTISSPAMLDESGQLSLGNSNDSVSSNVALGRRNSCPADFIQNFWSVQLDDKPSPGLPTIAEDETACPPQNVHQYLAAHQMMGRRMSEPNNRHTYSYSAPRYREQFAEVTPIIAAQNSYGLDPIDYSSQRSHNLAQTPAGYHMAPQLMRGHSLDSFIWSQQHQKVTPIATTSFARDHFNSFRGSDDGHSTVESYHGDEFSDATNIQPVSMVDPLEFTYASHAQTHQSAANISQINGSSASMARLQRRGSYPLQYVNYVTQSTTDNSSNPLAV